MIFHSRLLRRNTQSSRVSKDVTAAVSQHGCRSLPAGQRVRGVTVDSDVVNCVHKVQLDGLEG